MDMSLRQLRSWVSVAELGTFTDAALELGVSQAAVSRSVQHLERYLGVQLLHRNSRHVELSDTGKRLLPLARRILRQSEHFIHVATEGTKQIRLGYAWSAIGARTLGLQRAWNQQYPEIDLELIRVNDETSGLSGDSCDVAIMRHLPDARFDFRVLGMEQRYCAFSSDDKWSRRRGISLGELSERTILLDRKNGTTTLDLWDGIPGVERPRSVWYISNIDDWLAVITSGRAVGVTSQATAALYAREGVKFRPVIDSPPIAVYAAWWRSEQHPHRESLIHMLLAAYSDTK